MKQLSRMQGAGMLEVMVAALILGLTVTGSVVLLSSWGQTMGEAQNRTSALVRLSSVMDIGKHDSALISDLSNSYVTGAVAGTKSISGFTIEDVSVTPATNRDKIAASIQWVNPYESGDSTYSKFGLHSYSPKRSGFVSVSTNTSPGCVSNCGGGGGGSSSGSSKSSGSSSKSSKSSGSDSCPGGGSSSSSKGKSGTE